MTDIFLNVQMTHGYFMRFQTVLISIRLLRKHSVLKEPSHENLLKKIVCESCYLESYSHMNSSIISTLNYCTKVTGSTWTWDRSGFSFNILRVIFSTIHQYTFLINTVGNYSKIRLSFFLS